MKCTHVLALCLAATSLVSCTENDNTKASAPPRESALTQALRNGQVTYSNGISNQQPQPVAGRREINTGNVVPGPASAGVATPSPAEPAVQYPKDARWTLYCTSLAGPDRFARIKQLKEYFTAKSGLKDWYVVHNEQDSTLFYGFYSTVEKREPGSAQAHKDHAAISGLKDENGDRPLVTCFFTPITPPNPAAPAEWNLVNAPERAYWSVQVAAFKDNPQRKQAAVEVVKELRAKGYEAFYYHGQSISSVCIGAWPANAVKEQDEDSGRAVDEESPVLVSNVPLPAKYKNATMRAPNGQKMVAYAERIEIEDPSLKSTLREFPEHIVNYEAMGRKVKQPDGSTKLVSDPSFLVRVPREEPSGLSEVGVRGLVNPLPPDDPRRQPAGLGRLRGLGN